MYVFCNVVYSTKIAYVILWVDGVYLFDFLLSIGIHFCYHIFIFVSFY